jgi:hypothetical protein
MTPVPWWLADVHFTQPCGVGTASLFVWWLTNVCRAPYPLGATSLSAPSQSSVTWYLLATCLVRPRKGQTLCKVGLFKTGDISPVWGYFSWSVLFLPVKPLTMQWAWFQHVLWCWPECRWTPYRHTAQHCAAESQKKNSGGMEVSCCCSSSMD